MDTLQISPVGGFKPAAAPAGSTGGEASSAHPDSKSIHAPLPVFNPNGQTQDQVAAARATARAAEAKAEEAKKEAAKADDTAKALDLKVGLVSGSSNKVFVDIVDPKLNRTVYRIFGPPADATSEPQEAAPAHDAGAKPEDATNAYTKTGTSTEEHPANVKTEA
jgi:hypothetical protein